MHCFLDLVLFCLSTISHLYTDLNANKSVQCVKRTILLLTYRQPMQVHTQNRMTCKNMPRLVSYYDNCSSVKYNLHLLFNDHFISAYCY